MTTQSKAIKFEAEKDPNFKVTHIDGASGILNQNVGQLTFFYDIPTLTMEPVEGKPEMKVSSVKRILVLDVRMSPEIFKSISKWMADRVRDYETATTSKVPLLDPQTSYQ